VGSHEAAGVEDLVAIYDWALPQVYGYVLPRCGSVTVAEDVTAETFMAAVVALEQHAAPAPTVAWLIGIARHKLVDHWRRSEREQRNLEDVGDTSSAVDDPWREVVDVYAVHVALAKLSAPQRTALTLRYLDGLPVAEVADCVGRSLHATETLLVRARVALRRVYLRERGHDD
jgi:RNA polymerase sigma-70 factor (ECF subfamily)